jgi:uncharacterized protein
MRRALAAVAVVVVVVLRVAAPALAAPAFPPLTGRVVDEAGILSPRDRSELDAALAQFEKQTTDQIVVATFTSLQGLPIEDFGYQLGRAWQLGQAGKDNGALLIVAPQDRAVRIETGYGVEGELTDAASRLIIENEILPRFRAGDYPAGIKAGVAEMIRTLGGTYDPVLPRVAAERDRAPAPLPLAFILPILLIFILNRVLGGRGGGGGRRGRRGGYGPVFIPGGFGGGGRGGGGFGGGGGFSGGGGSFGGGGATGRW